MDRMHVSIFIRQRAKIKRPISRPFAREKNMDGVSEKEQGGYHDTLFIPAGYRTQTKVEHSCVGGSSVVGRYEKRKKKKMVDDCLLSLQANTINGEEEDGWEENKRGISDQ